MQMIETDNDPEALLDSLYLEMFSLIEQQVRCKVEIEKHHNSGQILLAKTRYIQGSQSVGLAQIPTKLSSAFNALCRVNEVPCDDSVYGKKLCLLKNKVNNETAHPDPLKWFSVLPPSSLRLASEQFQKCIQLVVESANLQRQLQTVINCILKIKQLVKVE